MTVVDYIDLDDDECHVKVDFVDLITDEDTVEKDGNVPEDEDVAWSVSSSVSEQVATPTTSFSKLEQEHAATASLSVVEHDATTSALIAEVATQPENQEVLAVADCVTEGEQYEHDAAVFPSMTAQCAATSFLLTKQDATASSLREDKSMLSGNQVFVAAVDCAKDVTQSENTAKASGWSSITEGGAVGVKGEAGNAMVCNLHAHEEPDGDKRKNENCNVEAKPEVHCQEVSQDVLAMSLPPRDKEKEISQCRKLYFRKGKKKVNTSTKEWNIQLNNVHSKGVPPTLENGDSGFSVMGNVCDGTPSIGISILHGEDVASNYQECNKTSQGNTMDVRVRDSGSEGCMVEGCTNGAHGGTPLCVFHNSWPHKRCCAAIGCATAACISIQGRIGCCVKHGGGKRCKYDGCGKGAQGKTDFCIAHGGGRRCKFEGCRKSAQGRSDYCVQHGGGRRCRFQGCSASATYGKDLCSMHRRCMLSGNNSAHEMLPAPACWAKKAERSKGRYSCSVIGGKPQKRQNTNDYVNTRSFNIVETTEENGRVFICENNMLIAQ